MLAQPLDVARFEPGALQRCDDGRQRRELPVGADGLSVAPHRVQPSTAPKLC